MSTQSATVCTCGRDHDDDDRLGSRHRTRRCDYCEKKQQETMQLTASQRHAKSLAFMNKKK